MKKSELTTKPEYFDRYIDKCDDVELLDAIRISIEEVKNFPLDRWRELGDRVYAPGKWTVKDILQHLIDTERIFSYRALAFARGEKQQLPSFNEDEYAIGAAAGNRSLEDLVDELISVHESFLYLYKSFTPGMLERVGMGFKGEYSVAAIGFFMPGHQRWHIGILEERYYPMLQAAVNH